MSEITALVDRGKPWMERGYPFNWFSDFSLWSSEKMKLLFWKSFDSECRQINGMENSWFSEFSEMIFRFLENENEMDKKDNQNDKKNNLFEKG